MPKKPLSKPSKLYPRIHLSCSDSYAEGHMVGSFAFMPTCTLWPSFWSFCRTCLNPLRLGWPMPNTEKPPLACRKFGAPQLPVVFKTSNLLYTSRTIKYLPCKTEGGQSVDLNMQTKVRKMKQPTKIISLHRLLAQQSSHMTISYACLPSALPSSEKYSSRSFP